MRYFSILTSCLLLLACNNPNQDATQSATFIPSTSKAARSYTKAEEAVQAWSAAINDRNWAALEALYAEEVYYYKDKISRAQCLARKRKALEKAPDFRQAIKEVRTVKTYYHTKEVYFEKEYGQDSKKEKLISMLSLVEQKDGTWLITQESDLITHGNKGDRICSCSDYLLALYNGGNASYYSLTNGISEGGMMYMGNDKYYYLDISFDWDDETVTFFPREDRGTHYAALGDYDVLSLKTLTMTTYYTHEDDGTPTPLNKAFLRRLGEFCR